MAHDNDLAVRVAAVGSSAAHTFGKPNRDAIRLLAGLGVEGDAHMGVTVRHRYRAARDPSAPNLRQVHLIHAELHEELRAAGSPSGRATWARTSPPAASTCSRCRPAPGCVSVTPRWWR